MTEVRERGGAAFFLEGPRGGLYATAFAPRAREPRAGVLFFPPFAEEMNRARRMVAVQARALAACGFEVLVLDPHGTGDSDGDFSETSWELWVDSMLAGWRWLERRSATLIAWSLRAGALLAADTVARTARARADHVFWQPAVNGATILDQFLRLRVAADAVGAAGARETVAGLREALARGESLEVAGYLLAPELANALASRTLEELLGAAVPNRVACLEVSAADPPAPTPALARLVARLQARGVEAHASAHGGLSFWSTVETVEVPALVEPTIAAFERLAA